MSAEPAYLICYDIADPRRLQRVHYYLKARALAVQYSVFFGRFSRERLDRLVSELPGIIDSREDDVRIYPVPEQCAARQVGDGGLPDWFVLAGDEIPRFLESYWKTPAGAADAAASTPDDCHPDQGRILRKLPAKRYD